MPAKFRTLGPFELKRDGNRIERGALQALWSPHQHSEGRVYRYAIGVYVIAVKQGRKLLPLYVGKSNRGFANRLNRHSIFSDIPKQYDGKSLFLFLIARVTSEREEYRTARPTVVKTALGERRGSQKLRTIDELEFALIGTCLSINPNLLNKHEKSFLNSLRVPGYRNDSDQDLDQSARSLRDMLT